MIVLIDTLKAGSSDAVLRNMYAARKEVFVDLLGWDVPVLDDRYELDTFDNEHARYLIITDREKQHLASARLLPTLRPHILDTLFPALCAGPVPRSPHVYEITRFCLDRKLRANGRRDARNRLVTALTVFALSNGIETYTGVAEVSWLSQILAFGWDAMPLGQALAHGGDLLGALRIEITRDTEKKLTANGIWAPTARSTAAVVEAKA